MRVAITLLLVGVMLAGCSGSDSDGDADNDGLSDSQEEAGSSIIVTYMGRVEQLFVNSDPTLKDTDGDGVFDLHELYVNSDPRDKDTDDDGLTDCQEVQHTVVEECEDPEWEGTTDGGYGTRPNNADSDVGRGALKKQFAEDPTFQLNPYFGGDGISDGDEVLGYWVNLTAGRRQVTSDPLSVDTDEDGLDDGAETLRFGSHPLIVDSDDDGCMDGLDLFPTKQERFSLQFPHFLWNEAGQSGTMQSLWTVVIADTKIPYQTGELQHGQVHELPDSDEVRVGGCTYSPLDPWIRIDLVVERLGDDAYHVLDLYSETNPPHPYDGLGTYSVWWNVHEDTFRWDADETAMESLEIWRGPDGELGFAPQVNFPAPF